MCVGVYNDMKDRAGILPSPLPASTLPLSHLRRAKGEFRITLNTELISGFRCHFSVYFAGCREEKGCALPVLLIY